MIKKTNSAVSPVIGVLLMLVVTIVIAAIVSGFAGGLASDQSKPPQVSLAPKVVIQNITGIYNHLTGDYSYPEESVAVKNGIMFEHKGGDPFSLNDISISLENQGITMIASGTDKINSKTCLPDDATDGTYFAKVGATDLKNDKIIEPGDKFMFFADNCYTADDTGLKYLIWALPSGTGYGPLNQDYKYQIIDRKSNKPIASGSIILK